MAGAFSRVASKPAAYDFIGIHHGTIGDSVDLFNRMLAHPENFSQIGDAAMEVAPPAIKRDQSALMDRWFIKSVTPLCPIRRAFARSLTYISLETVIFHELAHHANGHVDFLNATHNPSITNQPYRWNEGDYILRQTLEMDADATAAFWTLGWNENKRLSMPFVRSQDDSVNQARRWAYGSRQNYATSILLAGYATLRNYSEPWNASLQANEYHPTPAMRQKFLVDAMRAIIRQTAVSGYSEDQFVADAGAVFRAVEQAYARIKGEPVNLDAYKSVFETPESSSYFFKLEHRWARIRPELEKYMKVAQLSPVRWDLMPPAPEDGTPNAI
jgi:hypothetical protein